MFLILIACSIPALTFGAHFTWAPGPAEAGFLKEPQDKQGERQWKAGTYRGITVGKSTATVLFQKWGKPKYIGHWESDNPKNPKFRLYHYETKDALPGRLDSKEESPRRIMVEVEIKTGKVISIDIWTTELSLSEAIELFGKDYIETRYKRCNCDPDYETPLFESPDGDRLYIEYRSRGIAMRVDNGLVKSIMFLDKPIWFQSAKECEKVPQCRPKKKSIKRKRS